MELPEYYLKQYDYFDGEEFITFNIVYIDLDKKLIQVAVSNRGKISVIEYDLYEENCNLFFYYGSTREKIKLNEFENLED